MPDKLLFYLDDDSDDLATFLYVAKTLVIDVRLFNHSQHVLQQLRQSEQKPVAIFVDLNMPGINGLEVITEIANDPGLESIPVIAFSTASDRNTVSLAQDAGATCYIIKPLTIAQLKKTILFVFGNDWLSFNRSANFLIKP